MEDGDQNKCAIELLACPLHGQEQIRTMGEYSAGDLPIDETGNERSGFTDKDGQSPIAFCLWCGRDFYSYDEVQEHNANDNKLCPAFREFLNTRSD